MAEYIERDTLLEARELAICAYENAGVFNADAIRNRLKPLLDAVLDTPTAYVAPVVHGRWLEEKKQTFFCLLSVMMSANLFYTIMWCIGVTDAEEHARRKNYTAIVALK